MNDKSGLSFGDYDSDSIHRSEFVHSDIYRPNALNTGDIQVNTEFVALNDFDSSQPNRYYEPVEPDPLMQEIMANGINGLSQEQKDELLRRHLSGKMSSMSSSDEERKHRLESKKMFQKWAKVLLIIASVILLFSLVAIVTTVIYTSITTGTMSETGIVSAIISFFGEIIRTLLGQ